MPATPKRALVAVLAVAAPAALGVPAAEAATTLHATLSGAKEAPTKGDPNGRGSARITLQAGRGRVCYRISLRKVGVVSQGHIHAGRAGVAGNVVVPLFNAATRKPRGCVGNVAKATIRAIARHPGRYYVNVHNTAYPNGAARGQLHG
jgi:hypothetical protein